MSTVAREREYFTIAEVAMKLGVSAATVRRKIATGELRAVQLGGEGSSLRIRTADLERWLNSHATGGEAA